MLNSIHGGDVRDVAASLLDCVVDAVERVRGGGNNELFRISTARGPFALKAYIAGAADRRDRIGHEYGALTLLWGAGELAVPRPVRADRAARIAVYEWIVGTPLRRIDDADVDAALAFLARLHGYRLMSSAAAIPPAVEACIDAAALRAQVEARLARLTEHSGEEPELAAFLSDRFRPLWRRIDVRIGSTASLPCSAQTLSPSDFGAHNMLRRPDGRMAFLDFEYFGWDDPVKLVADAVWHPGSAFAPGAAERFIAGAQAIFGAERTSADRRYAERFALLAPAYGLRWALIALAEFIPERWERRRRAGETAPWRAVKTRQLLKAVDFCERAARYLD